MALKMIDMEDGNKRKSMLDLLQQIYQASQKQAMLIDVKNLINFKETIDLIEHNGNR